MGYYRPFPRPQFNLFLALIAGAVVLVVAVIFGR